MISAFTFNYKLIIVQFLCRFEFSLESVIIIITLRIEVIFNFTLFKRSRSHDDCSKIRRVFFQSFRFLRCHSLEYAFVVLDLLQLSHMSLGDNRLSFSKIRELFSQHSVFLDINLFMIFKSKFLLIEECSGQAGQLCIKLINILRQFCNVCCHMIGLSTSCSAFINAEFFTVFSYSPQSFFIS